MVDEVGRKEIYADDPEAQKLVEYALDHGQLELIPDGRKLKSGRISPYFFNSGKFSTADALRVLARAYVAVAVKHNIAPDVFFGPAYKGIPLAAGIALQWRELTGRDVGYAFNRKEEKDHGEGGTIVGADIRGKRVAIVDDVITSGLTSKEAVAIVRNAGGVPVAYLIAFDRQERGMETGLSATQQFERDNGIPVHAATTLADLIAYIKRWKAQVERGIVAEMLEKILAYRDEYGVK